MELLLRLMLILRVSQLARWYWHAIRAIDTCWLACAVQPPDLSRLRRLITDEYALFKGHRYAAIAICADVQQVLQVGEARVRKDVQPLFDMFGPEVCVRSEAVAMDINTAFDLEVRMHCPNARVIYDLFPIPAKFDREVPDCVRVDQTKALKADPVVQRVIERSRWLPLSNRRNLTEDQAIELDDLLAGNAPLSGLSA